MTPADPADQPLDTDELAVLAVLDGDATAEQRRRVARDPELVGRLRAAESAAAAVREPLDGPGEDVLATLRAQAVAAWDEPTEGSDEDPAPVDDADPPDDPDPEDEDGADAPPVRRAPDELAARRARHRPARRLPPLPAVAAVVILLVIVGVGLLVSGSQGSEDTASREATAGDATGGGSDADESADDSASEGAADAGPADEYRTALLARATTSYVDDETLFAALRQVDPTTLDLATVGPDGAAPTTLPAPTGSDATTTTEMAGTTAEADLGTDGRALADDGDVLRCDSVMRSAEPDLEPATAAVFVSVDGIPVVILSNPVPASDEGPATTRLTALNALDCSPRGAVQR